ncbi:MAG: hypothetical protein IPP12_22380 [Nitrospira sp.]|nr:hypothetical protein [Nitrospira sp.]
MSTRAEIEAELKSENEALQKRVAELDQKAYDLEMALGPCSAGALSSELADKLRYIASSQDNEFWDDAAHGRYPN